MSLLVCWLPLLPIPISISLRLMRLRGGLMLPSATFPAFYVHSRKEKTARVTSQSKNSAWTANWKNSNHRNSCFNHKVLWVYNRVSLYDSGIKLLTNFLFCLTRQLSKHFTYIPIIINDMFDRCIIRYIYAWGSLSVGRGASIGKQPSKSAYNFIFLPDIKETRAPISPVTVS